MKTKQCGSNPPKGMPQANSHSTWIWPVKGGYQWQLPIAGEDMLHFSLGRPEHLRQRVGLRPWRRRLGPPDKRTRGQRPRRRQATLSHLLLPAPPRLPLIALLQGVRTAHPQQPLCRPAPVVRSAGKLLQLLQFPLRPPGELAAALLRQTWGTGWRDTCPRRRR